MHFISFLLKSPVDKIATAGTERKVTNKTRMEGKWGIHVLTSLFPLDGP